jgi:5'-nucleotidase
VVLSGINRGLNVAEDVTMSGTVAAAIEGMALGIPSIALSQMMGGYRGDHREDFATAERHGLGLVSRLLEVGWPKDVILNVNFPAAGDEHAMRVEVTRQGFRDVRTRYAEQRTDLRGRQYYWLGYRSEPSQPAKGTDLLAAYEGRISVTPLHIDLTHMATVHALRTVIGGTAPGLGGRLEDAAP